MGSRKQLRRDLHQRLAVTQDDIAVTYIRVIDEVTLDDDRPSIRFIERRTRPIEATAGQSFELHVILLTIRLSG
jgi:hypothetical protein